jgi:alkylation response protein AidB-like acyl-CoA dehydrogenase
MMNGANPSFSIYAGLGLGVGELIAHLGTDEQKKQFCPKTYSAEWAGTMCLTEPQAGSDVGAARTRAVPVGDGTYKITGTKIFISAGDHDLTDNIIHLVLARVDGAPAGTKGLTLFIVPKYRIEADGSLGKWNDVTLGRIEHKMGINGSATAVLNFGENDDCIGVPVGGEAKLHQGMAQMFMMMNGARISTGLQAIGVASSAYLNALQYAGERKQGPSIKNFKDPTAPRVSIIEHADVRRMLLDMKARVEGIRALAVKLTMHQDRVDTIGGKDDKAALYHQGQIDLLVPLVKAYGSDQAFRVCETAIQVHGGVGYTKDFPVEQYCRDAKIFSIYEGTNHIQSMDLVARKLGQNGGSNMRAFLGDVQKFAAAHAGHPALSAEVKTLGEAQEALMNATMKLMMWSQTGKLELVPLNANRFLEMMSEVTVGWLLLEGAVIAHDKKKALGDEHADGAFYAGKIAAAQYYARNVLPGAVAKSHLLAREDTTPIEIPDAGF